MKTKLSGSSSGQFEPFDHNQLVSLYNASAAIISNLNSESILNTVAKEITNLLGASSCSISSLLEDRNAVQVLTEYPEYWEEIDQPEGIYCLDDYPLTKRMIQEKKAIQINTDQAEIDPAELFLLNLYKVKSLLIMPLIFQEKVTGIIEIFNPEVKEYQEDEVLIAQLLANQAAISINNARLFSFNKQQIQEQQALLNSALLVSSSLSLSETLSHIAELMCKLTQATSSYISEYRYEGNLSRVIAEYLSPHANAKEKVSDLTDEYDHNLDQLMTKKIMENGNPFVYHIDDPDIPRSDFKHLQKYGGYSVLEIPFMLSDQKGYFVEIWESRQRREFAQNEIDLCRAFAGHASLAIKNAQLYEQTQEEISRRKTLEKELLHETLHDPLTNLPNRKLFLERLERAILRANRAKDFFFAVLYIDIDNFKFKNDYFGHSMGDEILIEVSHALAKQVRELDTVSRFGGDEFLVLLEGIYTIDETLDVAARIQKALNETIKIGEHDFFMTASIGITTNLIPTPSAEVFIHDADAAMYQAKKQGKGRAVIFQPWMREKSYKKHLGDYNFNRALKNGEFKLYYQPIVDLPLKKIVAFEALLRWEHPRLGMLFPNEFLSPAQDSGIFSRIESWILRTAISQGQNMQDLPNANAPSVCVNISINKLSEPGFLNELSKILAEIGYPPTKLVFEVTENDFIDNEMTVNDVFIELRKLGIRILLDDFGTGYSSLSYLNRFAVDGIKIDRSFIKNINPLTSRKNMIDHIVALAHDLGLSIVAEGIESQEQISKLIAIGCTQGQGFIYSPAIPPEQLPGYQIPF